MFILPLGGLKKTPHSLCQVKAAKDPIYDCTGIKASGMENLLMCEMLQTQRDNLNFKRNHHQDDSISLIGMWLYQ